MKAVIVIIQLLCVLVLVEVYHCRPYAGIDSTECVIGEEIVDGGGMDGGSSNPCWKWKCDQNGKKYGVYVCTPNPQPIDLFGWSQLLKKK